MMNEMHCRLRITRQDVKLLVTTPGDGDVLQARLEPSPRHPRALLTLLEGLRLWSGQTLHVAVDVAECCPAWRASALLGDELWPVDSPLVQFELVVPGHPEVRLSGVGDFEPLRKGMP